MFWGGGFYQLGVQLLGITCMTAWSMTMTVIVFTILDKTMGVRMKPEEEILGATCRR